MAQMSRRQKAYREYLRSEHWAGLRAEALARDREKCCRCGSVEWLQVHHLCYRGRYEDSLLKDLETVCRKCHRKEHGLGPSDFVVKAREMEKLLMGGSYVRPTAAMWHDLVGSIETMYDSDVFGDVMFDYVFYVLAHEAEGHDPNWWFNKPEAAKKWRSRAMGVRKSIKQRTH